MKEIIEKPWGHEEIWAKTDKYVGKILFIKKGYKLSLQHHEVKDETIRVLTGRMALKFGPDPEYAMKEMPLIMMAGDSRHIPPGIVHRMIALEDTYVLEVSTPEIDDVVRHQDDYGRVK